jgi:hypothetical protein
MGSRAAKDGTAAAATALGGEVQSLVPTFSDSMHDGSKQSIGGSSDGFQERHHDGS